MKNAAPDAGETTFVRRLSWLYPATYLIHLGEELWGGDSFPRWLARAVGAELGVAQFLLLNSFALVLVIIGAALAAARRDCRWLLVVLATTVGLNGFLHLLLSLVTATYSPGTISGAALWLPLGWLTLRAMRGRIGRRGFRAGVLVGMFIQIVVAVLTLSGGRLPIGLTGDG